MGDQVWNVQLETEMMIAEAAFERHQEMKPLWERANNETSRKPFTPSQAQSGREDIPQRRHFIPRFWLVGFAEPPVKAGKVNAVDLVGEKRTSKISPKRAATEGHFYTLTGNDGQSTPVLEDLLGFIENNAAPGFKKLASSCLDLDPVERLDVALMLAAQIVRTPTYIRAVQQDVNEIGRKIVLQGQHLGVLPPMEGDYNVNSSDEYAVGLAFNSEALEETALILFCRRWSLFKASKDSGGFVLPEHPIVMWSGADRGLFGPEGVLNAHRILVPVSRKLLLVMHWTEWTDDVASSVYDISAESVHALNIYMCMSSGGRTVFCNPLDTPNVYKIKDRTSMHVNPKPAG